jgi:hypothetical protein
MYPVIKKFAVCDLAHSALREAHLLCNGWADGPNPEREVSMPLNIQLFVASSAVSAHPSVDLTVPQGFKIVGGGALDNWNGAGNLLTASFPKGPNTWSVAGKDHEVSSPASITAFALALEDPNNEWDVIITQETSDPAPHPQAVAILPQGFTLTGGGAFVDWHGAGNLLTASFPNSDNSWEARSKDHDISDPSRITAFAIGARPRSGNQTLIHIIDSATGVSAPHPNARTCLAPEWRLSGGGALDQWSGAGNLLTASFPHGNCWFALGKDHLHPSPAAITVFAIGLRAA